MTARPGYQKGGREWLEKEEKPFLLISVFLLKQTAALPVLIFKIWLRVQPD